MLRKLIIRWLKLDELNQELKSKAADEVYGLDNLDDDVIGELPDQKGIPIVQTNVILERMESEIRFIENELGMTKEDFNKYMRPVMVEFVRYADLLPAAEYKHHATGGGLIAHSFDVAKRAMRMAHCTQYPVTTSITDTQRSNLQWRAATVLAALLHDGGKVLADLVVSNGEDGDERIVWDAHGKDSINAWGAKHKFERYYISWRRKRHQKHQNASLMVMQRLIPQETWSWIESCLDGKEIHTAMLNAVAKAGIEHPMSEVVAKCDSDSVRANMTTRNSHITREVKRVSEGELMCDFIRHYILSRAWPVNQKNAVAWYVENRLYIVWHNAASVIIDECNEAGIGIPNVPDLLARIMIEEGLAVANGDELYHSIRPEVLGDPKKPVTIKCLMIRNPERVVIDESKLFSIRQHPEKKIEKGEADGKKGESQPTEAVKPVSSPVAKVIHSKSGFESSLDTVNRILGLMKKKSSESVSEVEDANSDDTKNMGDAAHQEEGIFDDHAEHATGERSDETEPGRLDNQDLGSEFTCDIAKFIASKYEYPVVDGKIAIPQSDRNKVIHDIRGADLEGINPFSIANELANSNEVAFV